MLQIEALRPNSFEAEVVNNINQVCETECLHCPPTQRDSMSLRLEDKHQVLNSLFMAHYRQLSLTDGCVIIDNEQFNLKAVVVHQSYGEGDGHYIAVVNVQGQYYECSDERVTPIDSLLMVEGSAVMTLFQRSRKRRLR